MATPTPLIGVIGGSGLYKLPGLTTLKTLDITTPWGKPSSPITIASLPSSPPRVIAFIARHGFNHDMTPSEVPSIANIAALKHLGVVAIVAFSAVGSLRETMKPRDVVIPNQIIDRTKGIRMSTFFQGLGVVGHVSFGDPFDTALSSCVVQHIQHELEVMKQEQQQGTQHEESTEQEGKTQAVVVHENATVVCMEGPQFSTRAESEMYRMWGGDIINMSVLPEAKLARECELAYCLIAQVTDYDSWRVSEESVTVTDVMSTIQANVTLSNRLSLSMLSALHDQIESGHLTSPLILASRRARAHTPAAAAAAAVPTLDKNSELDTGSNTQTQSRVEESGPSKESIMTQFHTIPAPSRAKLAYILPHYFS